MVDLIGTNVTGRWFLLEKEFTVPSNITQLNLRLDNNGGGNVWFDDVRLYPSEGKMSSYTYSPLIGVTSQTDMNNRTAYYEYDVFGRLALVRDNDKNILKKICYNYAGQVQECSDALVGNTVQSAVFTRNNSGTNGTGSTFTYTVPASTYFASTVAAANALAVSDLNANGQALANANAGCTWVNQAQNGSFTRNNCAANYSGSTVTYTIAAGTYSSTVSLADANQLAVNAVNSGGQAYANANGTCTFTCTTGNCTGQNKKCVNNVCETGIKVYTYCEQVTQSQRRHYYHYEFSDGSWSQTYTELNSNPCLVD